MKRVFRQVPETIQDIKAVVLYFDIHFNSQTKLLGF